MSRADSAAWKEPRARGLSLVPARVFLGFVVWLAACLFGLWTSLNYHFGVWGLDSDTAAIALLWRGIRRHGLHFVQTWGSTQDNWLFTLLPPTALLATLAGSKPALVVGLGWFIFCANVMLVGAIAWQMSRRAAILVLPVLLLLGQDALGGAGYLSHPVSHDATMLYGLVALLAAFAWIRRRSLLGLAALAACLAAAVLSDPWAAPAFALPILAAASLGAIGDRGHRGAFGACAGIALLVLALLYTQAFGWLSFLPKAELRFTDWAGFVRNGDALAESLGLILDPFPIGHGRPPRAATFVVSAIVVCLAACAVWALRTTWRGWNPAVRFLAIASGLACVVPVCAFLSGSFPPKVNVGRFVMPLAMMLPALLLLALEAGRLSRWGKGAFALFTVGLVVAGVLSNPAAWLRTRPVMKTNGVPELTEFLETHGLRYGYGAFWGTNANAITLASDGKVRVRPVLFDKSGHIARRFLETSSLWYEPGDRPKQTSGFFVAVARDSDDCQDIAICLRGVQQQFGPAERELVFSDRNLPVPEIRLLIWTDKTPVVPENP